MTNQQNSNNQTKYDLEIRTLEFAKTVVKLCRNLPTDTVNSKLIDQLIRSASSVGANYREANDSLGKKDFIHRLRISRKESKETIFWLELIKEANVNHIDQINYLIDECVQLRNILSTIINKMVIKNGD